MIGKMIEDSIKNFFIIVAFLIGLIIMIIKKLINMKKSK